jgi:hypothetical protein
MKKIIKNLNKIHFLINSKINIYTMKTIYIDNGNGNMFPMFLIPNDTKK